MADSTVASSLLIALLSVAGLAAWATIFRRWREAKVAVAHEPRREVPWGGAEVAACLLIGIAAPMLVSIAAGAVLDSREPAQRITDSRTVVGRDEQVGQPAAGKRAVEDVKSLKQLARVKMAFYHFGNLKRGAKRDEVLKELDEFKRLQIHKAHVDYLNKLARTGRLVLCGRFLDRAGKVPGNRLVLFQSKARTAKQAYLEWPEIQKLMATDPWVSRGVLRLELNLWRGPAGITYPGQVQSLKAEKPAQQKTDK